ncbi:hypothetical protein BG000_007527 [Podila horticola]|nr:hypothetical protein BG000_007527 [Podila horticola]
MLLRSYPNVKHKQGLVHKTRKQLTREKKQEENSRTVMVTNLDPKNTLDDLWGLFNDFGKMYSTALSHSFSSKGSRACGRAYLVFHNTELMVLVPAWMEQLVAQGGESWHWTRSWTRNC